MAVLERLGGRRATYGGRRALLVLAVLAAFLFQSFLTATHVHTEADSIASSVVSGHAAAQSPAHRRVPVEPANNCPICHAVAQSGHYLASAPIVFAATASIVIWLYIAAFRHSVVIRRSHAWRSRAPPE